MDISEDVYTDNSFVKVAVASCEWNIDETHIWNSDVVNVVAIVLCERNLRVDRNVKTELTLGGEFTMGLGLFSVLVLRFLILISCDWDLRTCSTANLLLDWRETKQDSEIEHVLSLVHT